MTENLWPGFIFGYTGRLGKKFERPCSVVISLTLIFKQKAEGKWEKMKLLGS